MNKVLRTAIEFSVSRSHMRFLIFSSNNTSRAYFTENQLMSLSTKCLTNQKEKRSSLNNSKNFSIFLEIVTFQLLPKIVCRILHHFIDYSEREMLNLTSRPHAVGPAPKVLKIVKLSRGA